MSRPTNTSCAASSAGNGSGARLTKIRLLVPSSRKNCVKCHDPCVSSTTALSRSALPARRTYRLTGNASGLAALTERASPRSCATPDARA
jgi:hypothetical protein